MPLGYNALAARPKNKLAYPGQDLVEAFTQGLGPMLYGAAKGTAATVAGLPGDIEQLARQLLLSGAAPDSYTAKNMAAQALLPTSDRVKAMLPSLSSFGAGPQAQYTENMAANLGQNIVGNIVAPKALPAIVRAGQGLPVGGSIKAVGAGVPRNAAALKAAVGNEPDIIRSLLGVPEYKNTGIVPQSAIDEALMTRQIMKAQPATTPGRKASIDEWKQWGEKHGVNMTLTEPQSLGITDLTSKREIKIPGGLEGTFTIPDMFWMKANNIDPAALPKATHDALMQKLIRTHEVENPDQVDVFNRLNFALLSPNAPLTPNEFLAQRMRLTNMEELQALAGRVGEPGLSQTAQQQTGVQAAARGGMGVLGTADLKNQAMLAKLILDKPEMFQMAPGETMRDVTMRVMNQVPGLGPKTASLGTPWLNLEKANTSAVDLHMIRNSYERMLNDPLVGDAFRERMAGKLGVEPTAEAILGLPTKRVEKAAIDVIGGSSMEKKYRLASGELNAIPDIAAPGRLAYEPKQLTDFNPFYKRVVDYVDESRGPNPVLELFPEQWRKWDVYRQRLEPHEFAHPDYRSLPRQSWQEMKDSLAAHKEAGYTQARNPVMKETDWRNLYYGKVDPTLLPGLAGAAAGTGAVINYLNPDNSR
jgi:hypothetical protein